MEDGCSSRTEFQTGGPLHKKEADNERDSNGESYVVGSTCRFDGDFCSSPKCGCLFTYVYYIVTSDGDDFAAPNAFKIPKRHHMITIGDVRKHFPLPGTYHFRIKVKVKDFPWSSDADRAWTGARDGKHHREQHQQPFVWLDFQDDLQPLPLYDQRIFVKATRLSWHPEPQTVVTALSQPDTLVRHVEQGSNPAYVEAEQQKKMLQHLQYQFAENRSRSKLLQNKESTRDSRRQHLGSGIENARRDECHIAAESAGQRSHTQQLQSAKVSTSLSGADMLLFDEDPASSGPREDVMSSTAGAEHLMPPVRFKIPQEIRIRMPGGRIHPVESAEVRLGKSIVAAAPHRVTAEQLEDARRILKRCLGRSMEVHTNVFATYAVTRKPEGTKMGQGKGNIDRFVARVPAGRVLFHIPQLNAFHSFMPQEPNFAAFNAVASRLPTPVVFREQNNFFELHAVQKMKQLRQREEQQQSDRRLRARLKGFLPPSANDD